MIHGQSENQTACVHTGQMVTLMPRLPFSENLCASVVSNTRQSFVLIAVWTPSCIDLGVASHTKRRL